MPFPSKTSRCRCFTYRVFSVPGDAFALHCQSSPCLHDTLLRNSFALLVGSAHFLCLSVLNISNAKHFQALQFLCVVLLCISMTVPVASLLDRYRNLQGSQTSNALTKSHKSLPFLCCVRWLLSPSFVYSSRLLGYCLRPYPLALRLL